MRIVWSREAQDDVFDILFHYDRIDSALADDMALRIERSSLPLVDFPELGPTVPGTNVRKWLVPGTPFLLLYAASALGIEVRRVRHGASDWSN